MALEITTALLSWKSLRELLKSATGLANQHAITTAISDVTSKLMDAQAAALETQEAQARDRVRIRELEMELEKVEGWTTEAARYALRELPSGKFVYSLKPESANGEPQHLLCPNCFNENKKSILQFRNVNNGQMYDCQKCKQTLHIPGSKGPPVIMRTHAP